MLSDAADPAPDDLSALRSICLALPEAHEEAAWVGIRWRIRKRTFAHAVAVTDGWPGPFARAAGIDGPATVITFRSAGPELHALGAAGLPYFVTHWGRDVAGLVLGPGIGWDEITELLTESYCLLAPRRLAATVERPPELPR